MSPRPIALAAALMLGVALVPQLARAQFGGMGSALSPFGAMQQGAVPAGVSDLANRGTSQTPEKTIKDVRHGLQDADPNIRVQELKKLRAMQSPEANKILIESLIDPDIRVRIKATDLLGARQATEAVEPLSQLLFLRSTEPVVKLHATAALGRIGDVRGVLPVIQYLEQLSQSGDDERGRGTAVFALGEIGSDKAQRILATVADGDKTEMVRRLAREALEKIDGELPNQHSKQLAQQEKARTPTDERLNRLRALDEKLQAMER